MASEPFVDLFLDYTKELESSTAFFRWSAFACIAALLRDNVYLPDGPGFIYPNIYVLLLADSASHRKARGPDLTGTILSEVNNTKIIRGRTSIQSVIEDLGAVTSSKSSGQMIKGGSCIMIADELASFVVKDPQAVPILTDIYDYRREWTSSLKGTGKTKITNLCVTMLAGSNEQHLKSVYSADAVFGGLLGRTFFVKPDEIRPGNALFGKDPNQNGKYNLKPLFNAAREISKIKGEISVDPAAAKLYNEWYIPFRAASFRKQDRSGVLGRIHTSIKKIAMILCVGQDYDLVIRRNHVEEAIETCIGLLGNYESYAMSSGKSPIATSGAMLLDAMWERPSHSITKKEFLLAHWADCSEDLLTKVETTLQSAGLIELCPIGSELTYSMTPRAEHHFSERQKREATKKK